MKLEYRQFKFGLRKSLLALHDKPAFFFSGPVDQTCANADPEAVLATLKKLVEHEH
jgi:hypothetical protein